MQTDAARDGNESGSSTNSAVETQQVPQFGAMTLHRKPATSLFVVKHALTHSDGPGLSC